MTMLLEQSRSYRRINSAAHSNYDPFFSLSYHNPDKDIEKRNHKTLVLYEWVVGSVLK
jgi:hypothetical protein